MEQKQILKRVDHTLLTTTATWREIQQACDEGILYQTATVCIAPAYVKQAAEYVEGKIPICTVVGFPNGYMSQTIKELEAKDALQNGASEIDMVIQLGFLKEKRYEAVEREIRAIREICQDKILKVIVEACLLTEDEKRRMCDLVTRSGADYLKTSTGFSHGGATLQDVEFFVKHVGEGVKIKAAGGISSLEDARAFLSLGADRLGTSRMIQLIKKERNETQLCSEAKRKEVTS